MEPPAPLRRRVRQALHLSRRFLASLSQAPPSADEDRWIRDRLLPGEAALWQRMSPPDQRHGVLVASEIEHRLPGVERAVVAAAALHDVGKVVSDYGTIARVAATLFWASVPGSFRGGLAHGLAAGRGPGRIRSLRRLGQYRIHPELGRQLLQDAGAEPLTAAWACEHHLPEHRWTVDPAIGRILRDCDND